MKNVNKFVLSVLVFALSLSFLAGCSRSTPATPLGTVPVLSDSGRRMANPDSLVNVTQLKELIGRDNVVVVDYTDNPSEIIPGAIHVDRTKFIRTVEGDNQSIETQSVHERVLGEYGIGNDTIVIVYDNNNNLQATRFLWQLRAYGHRDVRVLDGGTKAWVAAGESVTDKAADPKPAVTYKAVNRVGSIRADLADVLDATNNPHWSLIDTRRQSEWDAGRVPSATQFHYPDDFVNADGTFKTYEEYEALFRNVPRDTKLITYCQGGIRAATSWYVLTDILGWENRVLNYDGSWANYSWSNSPVEK